MKYPNAAEGVKKLFTAGIIELIGATCAGILLLASFVVVQSGSAIDSSGVATDLNVTGLYGGAALMLVFGLATIVLLIIALVFKIKGVNLAKRDEQDSSNFSMAFWFIIFSLVLSIANAGVTSFNQKLAGALQTGSEICNYLGSYTILMGIMAIAEALADAELAKKAKSTANILCVAWILTIATEIVARFVSSNVGAVVTVVVSVAGLVFSILACVFYLIVLSKAKTSFAKE